MRLQRNFSAEKTSLQRILYCRENMRTNTEKTWEQLLRIPNCNSWTMMPIDFIISISWLRSWYEHTHKVSTPSAKSIRSYDLRLWEFQNNWRSFNFHFHNFWTIIPIEFIFLESQSWSVNVKDSETYI